LGAFSYSFLLIFAKELGFQTTFVPVLYLIFTLVASLFALPFGRLADKIGRKPVLILSFLFWMGVSFTFIFLQSSSFIFLAFVLYGLHRAALEPVQKTFVSELALKDYRASVLGGYQMIIGLFSLPASFLAGFFWDQMSRLAPFYFSLILTMTSTLLLTFVKENRPKRYNIGS
jgi:MFS family permease